MSTERVRQPNRGVQRGQKRSDDRGQVTCNPETKANTSQNEASRTGASKRYYSLLQYLLPRAARHVPSRPRETSPRAVIRHPTSIPHKSWVPSCFPVPPPLTEAVAAASMGLFTELLPTRIRSQTQVAAAARAVAEAAAAAAAKTDS